MTTAIKYSESQIRSQVCCATGMALHNIEWAARDILRKHANLGEFVMAMGVATFTDRQTGDTIELGSRAYMATLDGFIGRWDNCLKLTGNPMRFTAYGPTITDW
jgi:hypothetical protein